MSPLNTPHSTKVASNLQRAARGPNQRVQWPGDPIRPIILIVRMRATDVLHRPRELGLAAKAAHLIKGQQPIGLRDRPVHPRQSLDGVVYQRAIAASGGSAGPYR